jgi:ribosomal protein L4
MVETAPGENLAKASRNLAGVKLVTTTMLQPYDLLRHDRLMLTRAAAEKLSRGLGSAKAKTVEIQPAPKTKSRGAKD